MAFIYKHPRLTDYFDATSDAALGTPPGAIAPIVASYEAPRALLFPKLKLDIDFDFWAGLPTSDCPRLKKLSLVAPDERGDTGDELRRKLARAGVPTQLEAGLRRHIGQIYRQVLPIYHALFRGYRFTSRRAVWRLATIRNENMHVDTYREPQPDHFARMFINLDNQPRIWHASWTAHEVAERFGPAAFGEAVPGEDDNARWSRLNATAFGGRSAIWWDDQPRHVLYFEPGDVWVVDSRQIAHQIFYGRRAVSIDFFVDPATMLSPDRHYLAMSRRFGAEFAEGKAWAG